MSSEIWSLDLTYDTGESITGQVTDQSGDPVNNATVEHWGISETVFDESAIDDLESEITSLEQDLNDLEPEDWQTFTDDFADAAGSPMLDLEAYRDDIGDTTYPLVHEEEDWGVGTTTIISSSVDDPRITTDADQPVIISLWDPDEGGTFIDNQVDQSFPGATTDGTVVIEQLGPSGIEDTRTVDTRSIYETTGATPWSTNEHHAVRTSLPEGVYRVYPDGNPAASYTFTVGEPDAIFDSWTADLENQLTNLGDRADILSDEINLRENADFDHLVNEGIAVRERTTTNETGHFELEVDSSVRTVNVQAYKADGEILEIIESAADGEDPSLDDVSIQDLREYRLDGYNGSFYLPMGTTTVDTTQEEIDPIEVQVYRSNGLPLDDIDRFEELQEWLENEFFDQNLTDFENQFEDLIEGLENEELDEFYEQLEGYAEHNDELRELIEEFDENDDLEDRIIELQEKIDDLETITAAPGDGEIDDGLLEFSQVFPMSIDDAIVTIVYENGDAETVPEEYVTVQSAGILSGDEVVVEGYEIDTDRAVADVRVQTVGENRIATGSSPIPNPAFQGSVAELDAVQFSTLAPGPDERLTVGLTPSDGTEFEQITSVEAFNGNDEQIDAEITDDDRVSFRTDGEGVHTVRMTYESASGDTFQVTERVRAGEAPGTDRAVIRAGKTAVGPHAVVGADLESARITEADDGTLEIDAIIGQGENPPGELHVMPERILSGDVHELEISIYEGDLERQLEDSHVAVQIHFDSYSEDAIAWRDGDAIYRGGDTRHGEVQERESGNSILSSYTHDDGTITITVNADPNRRDRFRHAIDQYWPSFDWDDLSPLMTDLLMFLTYTLEATVETTALEAQTTATLETATQPVTTPATAGATEVIV
ncbi:hypothetical protein [Natronosalvus amylolyticus]|uniref:hypothetical protein n=1 Tax=Natronosalvus amylolyticus TaxID=2961994 RepID=UPI0020C9559A|nr:hypothetical protein [Natronosalvus amylolyticus]